MRYLTLMDSHQGQLDLYDTISVDRRRTDGFHDVILIRRYLNDAVFPYHTDFFIRHYITNSTDPVTREDLSHVWQYVAYKRMCWENFGHVKTTDVTPDYRMAVAKLWREQPDDPAALRAARAFVDLHTLQQIGFIQPLNADEAVRILTGKPEGSWMIRHTTNAWPMKNVDVFSVSVVKTMPSSSPERENLGPRVIHHRYAHLYGAGVFEWCSPNRPASLREMYPDHSIPEPVFATPFDGVTYYIGEYGIDMMYRPSVIEAAPAGKPST